MFLGQILIPGISEVDVSKSSDDKYGKEPESTENII